MATSSPAASPKRVSRGASPESAFNNLNTTTTLDAMLESSSDEADDEILKPRGKLASRMQATHQLSSESASESEKDDAPERVQRDPASQRRSTTASQEGQHEEDEDDVVTTRPRNLLAQRRQRSATPPDNDSDEEGLFVTPSKPFQSPTAAVDNGADSDDYDLPDTSRLAKNPRFAALVAQKTKERKAREAEEKRKREERLAAQRAAAEDMSDDDQDVDDITDDEGGRKLTQQGARRPPRQASKKALEEMSRETQRLARSMQLAHEAKVKKKITKASLFERFNYKLPGATATAPEPVPVITTEKPAPSSSRAASPASVQQHTDVEMRDTPPSSPPPMGKEAEKEGTPAPAVVLEENADGELPTLEEALALNAAQQQTKKLDKGKGIATAADLEAEEKASEQPPPKVKRNLRVKLPAPPPASTSTVQANLVSLDDDDDLEIGPATTKSKIDAIFERLPAKQNREPRPMQILRRLAHIDDPEKAPTAPVGKNKRGQPQKPTITVAELQANLLQESRRQAKQKREEYHKSLRERGHYVPTDEELEKELNEVDDIVEQERRRAEEIMQREREEAKKERKERRAAGEVDPIGWDDSDEEDESFKGSDAEEGGDEGDAEEEVVELSGSEDEDEEMGSGAEEVEDEDADPAAALFDENASESAEGEEANGGGDELASDEDEDVVASSKPKRRRARKQLTVISDDEDDEMDGGEERVIEATPKPKGRFLKSPSAPNPNLSSPAVPTSVLRSATKTFIPGLPVAGPAGLGLTQIFAGTMDDSQAGSGSPGASPSQPMPTFDPLFPDSNFSQTAREGVNDDLILDSQPAARKETQDPETQGVQLGFGTQSQVHGFDSFLLQDSQSGTQMSELIEPTQDQGFQNLSPLKQRFVEAPPAHFPSTVDTVPVHESQEAEEEHNQSPLVRRVGKLRRRGEIAAAKSSVDADEDAMAGVETDEFGFGTVAASDNAASAFTLMKEAVAKEKKRKAQAEFDKKKSKAREMVDEQAEESEDEYAGLGGVDGDLSEDEDDESVKDMIDDETKNSETDERKLAAFHADRERAAAQKGVEKIFHDITTGKFRKRNRDLGDLSDDDDGGEARRRLKRRQFAKMQRSLFADERLSKVAENPRNQAFLRTLEERDSDDEMADIILGPVAKPSASSSESHVSQSQDGTQDVIIPNSQPQKQGTNPRRTNASRRPPHFGVREQVSSLLEEDLQHSSSVIPATELGSDSEGEGEGEVEEEAANSGDNSSGNSSNKENRNPRRTVAVVDRITLKRNSSSTVSTTSTTTVGANGRLAFAQTSQQGSFKVPALLRRATTNSSLITSSSNSNVSATGVTTSNGMSDPKSGAAAGNKIIKKVAGKRSGVSYLARETERRQAIAEAEKKREAKKSRAAEGRSRVVGGLFGGGKFE